MHLHEILHHVQSYPASSIWLLFLGTNLIEPFEDMLFVLITDTLTGIAYLNLELGGLLHC